ncbi:hypothetical protein BDW69DRAFT_185024 [Aspergillus filifer]
MSKSTSALDVESFDTSITMSMQLLKDAVTSFSECRPQDVQDKWKTVLQMIDTWFLIDAGSVDLNRYQDQLTRSLKKLKVIGAIVLHINAQNCGWMAYYDAQQNEIIIDAFEDQERLSKHTHGNQQNVDGECDRWGVIQDVFNLVEKQAFALRQEDPCSLDIEELGVRYPLLHFLKKEALRLLLEAVIASINRGEFPGLTFPHWPQETREGAPMFISSLEIEKAQEDAVRGQFDKSVILKKLLILRGLFAHEILHFALASKRWLVDYGVDSSRCLMAVPFRAKGIHQQIQKDNLSFQQDLYPHLQYQKGIIDFFLSRVVFPKEAKESPFKLAPSAWDIPSRPDQPPTTGFSGTDDNCYLLPLSMPQRDLPDLLHTNAMDRTGHQLPVVDLLLLIKNQDPEVRVIIDVGAQILESSNEDVAKSWLSMVHSNKAAAAVYINANDEAMVIDRNDYSERLFAPPFRRRMHLCLVFLDQHHSRGVDLKLPRTSRAAVTLGPRLTKDRLVQACYRMRELGNGQAVTFFIPPEVKHSISGDGNLEKLQPLWARQGLNYMRCQQIRDDFRMGTSTLDVIVPQIQEAESRSLAPIYAPWGKPSYNIDNIRQLPLYDPKTGELLEIWQNASSAATQLYEEQEREIVQGIQREQHAYRPRFVNVLGHNVDGDLTHFVIHGRFPRWYVSDAVRPAFSCLSKTTAKQFDPPPNLNSQLYATVDFLDTIEKEIIKKKKEDQVDDEFLKPVHWVLSNTQSPMLLIISQYEFNALLPAIRSSDKVTFHMYTPAQRRT